MFLYMYSSIHKKQTKNANLCEILLQFTITVFYFNVIYSCDDKDTFYAAIAKSSVSHDP